MCCRGYRSFGLQTVVQGQYGVVGLRMTSWVWLRKNKVFKRIRYETVFFVSFGFTETLTWRRLNGAS